MLLEVMTDNYSDLTKNIENLEVSKEETCKRCIIKRKRRLKKCIRNRIKKLSLQYYGY